MVKVISKPIPNFVSLIKQNKTMKKNHINYRD